MGYTLNRIWQRCDGAEGQGRRETSEGGETYAEAERRARRWWAAAETSGDAVKASMVVEIVDATDRVVASLKDSGNGGLALSLAGDGSPARERWLSHLRGIGVGAERVQRSSERLARLGSGDLAGEAEAETLDACAARVSSLIYRVDDMLRHGLAASGSDPASRLEVRRSVEATMDEADIDGYLVLTTQGRIQLPPSTLDPDRVPVAVEALLRVSAAMLCVCEVIEAHAAGKVPEHAVTPGR